VGMKRSSSSSSQQASGAVAADAWAATGVSTPVSTPAHAATQRAPSSHPSVHGELAAQPSAKKGVGLLVAAAGVAVVIAGGAWVMFGRGEPAARSVPPAEAQIPVLPSSLVNPTTTPPAPKQPEPPPPGQPASGQPVVAPIPAAPEPPPPMVVASAAHSGHKRHDPAHTVAVAKSPAAPPVAAAPVAAAASPPAVPSPPKGVYAEGEALFRGGDVEGALAKYQEAARANPSDAKAQKMIGKCYNRLGQHDRAVPYLKKYLELSPDASDKAFIQAQIDQK